MAGIPAGISTALVHLDAPVSFVGDEGRIHATITPSVPLVWEATGTPIGNFVDNISLAPGVDLDVPLPHTDQEGFLDGHGNRITSWYYRIEVTYEKDGQTIPFPTRDFQVMSGQLNVDLALIPAGTAELSIIAPILPVTDLAGLTGSVSSAELAAIPAISGKVAKGELVLNVMDYGAVGNGIADDTAAVQSAINAAPEHATILFPKKHLVTSVTLNKRYITLTGPGTLFGGKLVIGTTGARQDLYITIAGLTFERADRSAGSYGIELLKARRVGIRGCFFIGFDKSIYVRPFADATMHDTGMINIKDNEFAGCNYALYVDRDDAATWMHFSDSHFVNNTVNTSYITGLWIKSCDGIHITGNTFFTVSYDSSDAAAKAAKKQNIYMGQSNFFVISHNNLFEAGEESILIDQASRFTISNNNIAWPGQKQPSDAIRLTGTNTLNGIISDNVISKMTKDGIGIYATGTGTVSIKDNAIEYDAATGTYYGTPALSSFTHYGIYQDPISTQVNMFEANNDMTGGLYVNRKGSLISTVRINNDVAVSASKAAVTFTALTAAPVFTLFSTRFGQLTFSGEIMVEVKSGDTENGNISVYKFAVSKGPLGYYITKLWEQGLLTGGSANWPSFTFTIDDTNGKLKATPVGSTAGTFYFYTTATGNLRALAA